MPPKQRKGLTPEQVIQLKGYAAIRLPIAQIAAAFGISESKLEFIMKKSKTVRRAYEEGRASGSIVARKTLFERAFGPKGDGNGGSEQLMRFWCSTQEGFIQKDVLDINSKADVSELSDEETEARTQAMLARIAARRDQK